jgi:hypothetical protein
LTAAAVAQTQGSYSVIIFDSTAYSYGTLQKGTQPVKKLSFTNTGTAPLVLLDVHSSCGCMVAAWSKEPVLPAHKGEINLTYDASTSGPFNKLLYIRSRAVNNELHVAVKGAVAEEE